MGIQQDTLSVHSLGKSLDFWGWITHSDVCYETLLINFYCYVKNKFIKKYLYSQDGLHGS